MVSDPSRSGQHLGRDLGYPGEALASSRGIASGDTGWSQTIRVLRRTCLAGAEGGTASQLNTLKVTSNSFVITGHIRDDNIVRTRRQQPNPILISYCNIDTSSIMDKKFSHGSVVLRMVIDPKNSGALTKATNRSSLLTTLRSEPTLIGEPVD